MAGYPKIWTTLLSEKWFVPLSLNAKGLYLWLIVEAKRQGDTGHVTCTGWSDIANQVQANRQTVANIVSKFQQIDKVRVVEKSARLLQLEVVNYDKYQKLKSYKPDRVDAEIVPENRHELCTKVKKTQGGCKSGAGKSARVLHKKHNNGASGKVKGLKDSKLEKVKSPKLYQEADQTRTITRQAERNVDNVDKASRSVGYPTLIQSAFLKRFGQNLEGKDYETLVSKYGDEALLLFMIENITMNSKFENPVGMLIHAEKDPGNNMSDDDYDKGWKTLLRQISDRIK